jgi:hypothetical protein
MRLGYREYKLKVKSQQIPVPVIPDGHKQCSDCKEIKELNEINFRKNCGTKRYYCNRCDECQKYIDKIYAQTKRDNEKAQKQVEYLTNPDYKQCSDCNEYKPITDYYLSHAGNPVRKCKVCYKKYHRDKVEHKFRENGGTNHYYKDPDRYTTQEQKEQVFMVMEVLGWTYTDGVWWKEGIKDKDNVWTNIIPTDKPKRKQSTIRHGRKIKSGVWNNTDKIVKLIEEGYTYLDVADVFDCSHTTIRTVVSKYRNEKRAS